MIRALVRWAAELSVKSALVTAVLILVIGGIFTKWAHDRVIHDREELVRVTATLCERWEAAAQSVAFAQAQMWSAVMPGSTDARTRWSYWYFRELVQRWYPEFERGRLVVRPFVC